MNESLVLKAALITAIIGLIAISLIVKFTDIKEINLSEAKQADEGSKIKVTGTVQRVTAKQELSIITITKQENMTVVLFDSINLSKGQKIEATGKTQEYNGEMELVADKITVK